MSEAIKDRNIAWVLFLGFLGVYIHTLAPTIAPYRDVGEMVVLLKTLGVGHPPGYPLYTLFGKLFTLNPLGCVAYKVNFMSAFFGAGSLVFIFLTLRVWLSRFPSAMAAVFFGFSNPFWELGNVAEMYTLGIFWVMLLFWTFFALKNPFLSAFLMALGLGVRMDMMLLIPVFGLWLLKKEKFKNWVTLMGFFGLGLTLFFYLMIRSSTDPLIDWGNPETLTALFNSLSRKSYSGTLDLLSLSYKKGENFLVNLNLYALHAIRQFGWGGFLLIPLGVFQLIKKNREMAWFLLGCFAIAGPLFFFLANMPPNPHALAIMEAAYLVPDLLLALILGFGILFLLRWPLVKPMTFAGLPLLLILNATQGYATASKRSNYFAKDYATNVFRSAPKSSVLVLHEDVQLFSLWHEQLIENRRKDISLISYGLSSSGWYWKMLERWGQPAIPSISVKEKKGWGEMAAALGSRPFLAGQETETFSGKGYEIEPYSLLQNIRAGQTGLRSSSHQILDHLAVYRGSYRYGEPVDFFSSDLIADYARAYHRLGVQAMNNKEPDLADDLYQRAEVLEPDFPNPSINRGYIQFRQNNYDRALFHYKEAIRKSRNMIDQARRYKSLPSVVQGIKKDYSGNLVYAGAVLEKQSKLEEARDQYKLALDVYPNAQAHYNLAVTYWNKNWDRVIFHMDEAARINPSMKEALRYAARARHMKGAVPR